MCHFAEAFELAELGKRQLALPARGLPKGGGEGSDPSRRVGLRHLKQYEVPGTAREESHGAAVRRREGGRGGRGGRGGGRRARVLRVRPVRFRGPPRVWKVFVALAKGLLHQYAHGLLLDTGGVPRLEESRADDLLPPHSRKVRRGVLGGRQNSAAHNHTVAVLPIQRVGTCRRPRVEEDVHEALGCWLPTSERHAVAQDAVHAGARTSFTRA